MIAELFRFTSFIYLLMSRTLTHSYAHLCVGHALDNLVKLLTPASDILAGHPSNHLALATAI